MATGLKIPVGVNKSGGAAVETDVVKQKKKLLELAFSVGGDKNPFQTLGIDGSLIFSIKDGFFQSKARDEVERIFSNFSELVALVPGNPITFEDITEGEIEMNVKYVDLEVDEIQTFTQKFITQG